MTRLCFVILTSLEQTGDRHTGQTGWNPGLTVIYTSMLRTGTKKTYPHRVRCSLGSLIASPVNICVLSTRREERSKKEAVVASVPPDVQYSSDACRVKLKSLDATGDLHGQEAKAPSAPPPCPPPGRVYSEYVGFRYLPPHALPENNSALLP